MNRFINNIINEVTTSADVVYLPSGFGDIKKRLETLARLKKDWNIEILERDYGYEVNFEGKLKVVVERATRASARRFLISSTIQPAIAASPTLTA